MAGVLDGDFHGTFAFASHFVDAGDCRLHYVDEGPRESPPLLFLHGNPTWSYLWRHPIVELSTKGHRCVALDHMGFGRSDKPPRLSAYSLRRHVDNAIALIEALDLREVTLVAATGAARSASGRCSRSISGSPASCS